MARHRLNALRTYAEASEKETFTVPIRGRTPECKPIGDRRDTGFTIRREADESIVAKCYNSDLIRWFPDGRIFITNGGYASQTTHDFISRLMGRWAYTAVCGNNGETWLILGPDRTPYPLAKDGQYFTWGPAGQYLVAEAPNYAVTHQINRPAMRAARKEIAPFVKYFNNMMKLTEWALLETKTVYIDGDAKAHAAMLSNDAEEWGQLLEWLVQAGTISAYKHTQDPVTLSWTYGYRRYVSKTKIKDRLTTLLLRVHRSKLLTKRTHTKGGWVKDAYKDYADD